MYRTIFLLGYYGLFRIGELTSGPHPVRAADVHIGINKDKMLFILHTSKTHGYESRPQKIKVVANKASPIKTKHRFFCPFCSSREYLALRGNYKTDMDPFFIFRDQQPVTPPHIQKVLKTALKAIRLKPSNYAFQSLRIGHCTEMVTKLKVPISQVKLAGRWRSNVVYKYIRSYS